MSKHVKLKDGSVILDNRPSLDEWVKKVGGRFAILKELKSVDGVPSAVITTETSLDPVTFPIPDDVLLTVPEIYKALKE